MAIIARNLEGVSAVAVSGGSIFSPEPARVLSYLSGEEAKGMRFIDDTALRLRIFTLPALNIQIVFEPTRVRIDAMKAKKPYELKIGERLGSLVALLYPNERFLRYGFNYDIAYQYDVVIPQREIIGAFLQEDAIEDVTHFGWQCTRTRDKGKRRDTYFFKVVSPLEMRVMTNTELERELPKSPTEVQKEYEKYYSEAGDIVHDLAFT